MVWRLERAGGMIEVTAKCQVTAREVPLTAGRMVMPVTLRARAETSTDIPFSIKTIVI